MSQDSYNQAWLNDVAPQDWKNPQPADIYNIVVIGAGAAGLITAAATAGLGGKVALIEKHRLGGDCLNVGCVPSKSLLASAHAKESFAEAMQKLRRVRAEIAPNDSAQRFTDLGVDVFFGEGRLSSQSTVEVGGKTLRFHKAVIATGGRAAIPPIPGLMEAQPHTNESIFEIAEQPKQLTIIGAGVIGCEMAQAFNGLGSEVTLIDFAPQVLAREDSEAAAIIQQQLESDGVRLCLNASIEKVITNPDGDKQIQLNQDGQPLVINAEQILVAAGRAANVRGFGLEECGVDADETTGIKIDDQLRTSAKNIFAIGDVAMPYKFTHAADASARMVVQNALFGGRKKISDLVIPWTTYTQPELAQVGLTEASAAEQNVAVDIYSHPLSDSDRAIAENNTAGFVKILTAKGSDKIVGATIVANRAGDMLPIITVAMTSKLGLGSLANTVFAYPTHSEAIKRCADAYNRTKLTPMVSKLFRKWMAVLRWFGKRRLR